MSSKNKVLVLKKEGEQDKYYRPNLSRLCRLEKLPYHSIKGMEYPITFKNFTIDKVDSPVN